MSMSPAFRDIPSLREIFSRRIPVFFVGVGGIQMQGLARYLRACGYPVFGSDMRACEETKSLLRAGIPVTVGHREENIRGAGAVVYTLAVSENTPEIRAARRAGIPLVSRPELLGYLMSDFPTRIAVAGMHGKSTVTAMLSHIMTASGDDPAVFGGAALNDTGTVVRPGGGGVAIAEACEYRDAFLCLSPTVAVVLNIEHEHPDYFPDLCSAAHSFSRFVAGAETVILPAGALPLGFSPPAAARVIRFGLGPGADVSARALSCRNGNTFFTLSIGEEAVASVSLPLPGEHNLLNALAALATAYACGADMKSAAGALSSFRGIPRRLSRRGMLWGMTVYDDYAHHPTEIRASLAALRGMLENTSAPDAPCGRLICVFEPHTYSRTAAFFEEFTAVLAAADIPILLPIYAAREKNESGVSSEALAAAIPGAHYAPDVGEVIRFLAENARAGDILVLMGAGSIRTLTDELPCS